jgi:hypothetical protein
MIIIAIDPAGPPKDLQALMNAALAELSEDQANAEQSCAERSDYEQRLAKLARRAKRLGF